MRIKKSFFMWILVLGALINLELFNFSTTEISLENIIGSLTFLGYKVSMYLAFAFCGIDFAGIIGLFDKKNRETWYLTFAWIVAVFLNGFFTWFFVVLNLQSQNLEIIFNPEMRQKILVIAPIAVAVLVGISRVLIINSFSVAFEHFRLPNIQFRKRKQQQKQQPQRQFRQPQKRGSHPSSTRINVKEYKKRAKL